MHDPASLHRYGTPLPPIEDDEVPSKKPVHVQDQIATDEQGRRRFHGAFTGGFSAGYWNTVGSQEGWTPQSFKSSRSERAGLRAGQKPQDFMDDEDMGEFGIAPTFIKPSEDYATASVAADSEGRKRKLANTSGGPIPGIPVLEKLLAPVKDHVGVRILKSWGWRPGQGVGPRLTRKEKKEARKLNQRQRYVMEHYGDDAGAKGNLQLRASHNDEDDSDSDSDDGDDEEDEITFAPDDFEPYMHVLEQDKRFGLGYQGLSRDLLNLPGVHRVNSDLQVLDKNNKKVSIRGQAFGVGAFEDEDEDIYATDDMKRYDFTLDEGPKRRTKPKKFVQEAHVLEGFVEGRMPHMSAPVHDVQVPPNFKPRNWAERKSRFTPLDPAKARELDRNFEKVSLNPDKRGELLGEVKPAGQQATPEGSTTVGKDERTKALLELITSKSSNFVRGGLITADGEEKIPQKDEAKTEKVEGAPAQGQSSSFKPFLGDDRKQQRYEQFLAADLKDEAEIRTFLNEIQPLQMTEWDREMEQKEFVQARKIYRPLGGSMSDRFVTESSIEKDLKSDDSAQKESKKIVMQRTTTMWKPHSLLCKRYNIPEPYGGAMAAESTRSKKEKLSIFNYLEGSVNSKATFQTPVIIPKHIEKPQPIVSGNFPIAQEKSDKPPPPPEPEKPKESPATPIGREERKVRNAFVAKTELEMLVIESFNKPASEKVELYRAIFEDDSNDEVEDNVAKDDVTSATETAAAEPENNIQLSVAKSAAAANLLRNTSPARGIFAALFNTDAQTKLQVPVEPPKITFKTKTERWQDHKDEPVTATASDVNEDADAFYGPKMPERILRPSSTAPIDEKDIDDRLHQIFEKNKFEKSVMKYVEQVQKDKHGDIGAISSDSDTSSSGGDSSSDTSVAKVKKSKKKKSSSSNKKAKKKKKNKKHSSHGHGHTHVKEKKHKKNKDKKKTHSEKKNSNKSKE